MRIWTANTSHDSPIMANESIRPLLPRQQPVLRQRKPRCCTTIVPSPCLTVLVLLLLPVLLLLLLIGGQRLVPPPKQRVLPRAASPLQAGPRGSTPALGDPSSLAEPCAYRNNVRAAALGRINQRTLVYGASAARCTIIQNATIWDGKGRIIAPGCLLLRDGLIHAVQSAAAMQPFDCATDDPAQIDIVDAGGRVVTPGLVDMHTHLGMSPWPYSQGSDDVNEVGQSTAPFLSALDAFDPMDTALPLVLAGGVTSVLVIPGSANLIGGEGFVFKTVQPPSNLAEDMLVQANLTRNNAHTTGAPYRRWIKMACGENALRTYSTATGTKHTRMGSAFEMRSILEAARAHLLSQDQWCDERQQELSEAAALAASGTDKSGDAKDAQYHNSSPPFPSSARLDTLAAVLRGEVGVHWHCYLTHDIETQLRIAREFNFSVSAFHHALDLHRGVEALRRWRQEGRAEIGAAIFADLWGYKHEAYTASPTAPARLLEAGIPFAFKSDHPVLNSHYLAYQAARAVHRGLAPHVALDAVTSTPARLLKLGHRIGSIAEGMDADVVIWNHQTTPFVVGVQPSHVFVDGILAHHNPGATEIDFGSESNKSNNKIVGTQQQQQPEHGSTQHQAHFEPFEYNLGTALRLTNISRLYEWRSVKYNQEIALGASGKVQCVSHACPIDGDHRIVDMGGAVVTPHFVAAITTLGLHEILDEPEAGDGFASGDDRSMPVMAADGLMPGGLIERAAANGGIGLAISVPLLSLESPNLQMGVAVFHATNRSVVPSILSQQCAVYVDMRMPTMRSGNSAFSGRVAGLRAALQTAPQNSLLAKVRAGEMPLVLRVDAAHHMIALLNLQLEQQKLWPGLGARSQDKRLARWIFAGAAEAHLVARQLGEHRNGAVGVLLAPPRCVPDSWSNRRCLTNERVQHAAAFLREHRVPFGIGTVAERSVETGALRFEGGWVRRLAKLNSSAMVDMVSGDLLDLFGLDAKTHASLPVGHHARFNVWSQEPSELGTRLLLSFDATRADQPIQFPPSAPNAG